jgi:hypothetical protein
MTGNDRDDTTRLQTSKSTLNPGDEAPRGTPGTGDDVCPDCNGSGRAGDARCPTCAGRGTIVRGVGGG